jgi:hypothetical protein
MPTQHTLTSYSFSELSAKAKERARDWFRTGLEFDNEPTIEDAKQCLAFAGFEVDKVLFSGFSSQGDGACFEGNWRADRFIATKPGEQPSASEALMKGYAPQDAELHRIARELGELAKAHPTASLVIKHRGHYYHQYCTEMDLSISDPETGDEVDFPGYGDYEKALIELARDAMEWIYRQLEKDYDWQNEDEQVDLNILANDYQFNLDGSRFQHA